MELDIKLKIITYHPDVLGRKHGGDEEDSAAKKKTKTSEDRSGTAEISTGRTDKKNRSGVRSQGTHDEESQDQLKAVKDNAVVPDREVATTATQTMEEESKQEAIVPMVRVWLAGTRRGLTRLRPGCTRRPADRKPHPLGVATMDPITAAQLAAIPGTQRKRAVLEGLPH